MTAVAGDERGPDIAGYRFIREIGHGGFSDVYLYEQAMPRREVAIKVLRTDDLEENVRQQFAAEANLMARVSNHSNIAAIFAADIDDHGQPYLVMEYCSGGSLGAFYRHYPMGVKEVLILGIRLAGALEAAHRAGIVHRDIKPANILLTEYGVPVLADFGISTIHEELPESTSRRLAGTTHRSGRHGTAESSVGMSLPWAAPETLWEEPVSDARSDRYSFAATLYSLLECRSPHELPEGPNSAIYLIGRIRGGYRGPINRSDVPASLRAFLQRGLSHDRSARFDSAADMGRALQNIQRELGYEVTTLEVPRATVAARPPTPNQRVTQSQPIMFPPGHATLMPPEGSEPSGSPGAHGSAASIPRQPWDPPPGAQVVSGSIPSAPHALQLPPGGTHSGSQPTHQQGQHSAPTMRPWAAPTYPHRWKRLRSAYLALIAVLLVGCLVVAILLAVRDDDGDAGSSGPLGGTGGDAVIIAVPPLGIEPRLHRF